MTDYAPIAMFVYNRAEHTQRIIEALLQCPEAPDTDVIIFSDAARKKANIEKVNQVRNYLKTVSGFKSVKIVERKRNFGCTPNIIDGVTKVMDDYGRGIIIEDDILVSKPFLKFMNLCLNKYKDNYEIWSISGISPEFDLKTNKDVVVWGHQNCWSWATWKDRWDNFESNREKTLSEITLEQRMAFDFGGIIGCSPQLDCYAWDVAWNWTIFKNKKLCINPVKSLIKNIGLDGTGLHCGNTYNPWDEYVFLEQNEWELPDNPQNDEELVSQILQIKKKNDEPVSYEEYKKIISLQIKLNMFKLYFLHNHLPSIINLKLKIPRLYTFELAIGKIKRF